MGRIEKTVFISYRRTDESWAGRPYHRTARITAKRAEYDLRITALGS
jgi:hypothetical protein